MAAAAVPPAAAPLLQPLPQKRRSFGGRSGVRCLSALMSVSPKVGAAGPGWEGGVNFLINVFAPGGETSDAGLPRDCLLLVLPCFTLEIPTILCVQNAYKA